MDDKLRIQELEQEVAELRTALSRRDVIGQAKGVLMAQSGIDADAAFACLVHASQRENVKLYDIALRITRHRNSVNPDGSTGAAIASPLRT